MDIAKYFHNELDCFNNNLLLLYYKCILPLLGTYYIQAINNQTCKYNNIEKAS